MHSCLKKYMPNQQRVDFILPLTLHPMFICMISEAVHEIEVMLKYYVVLHHAGSHLLSAELTELQKESGFARLRALRHVQQP